MNDCTTNNDRLNALNILINVTQHKTPLSHLLTTQHSALTKELCFGVCRNYIKLQSIADHYLSKRPTEPDVWLILLIGLYQLDSLNLPKYAVIKETVALTTHIKKSWAKNFINAVLRAYERDPLVVSTTNLSATNHFNHPSWLKKRIMRDWPQHWQEVLKANDQHPPMTLRVNSSRITTKNYLDKLIQSNFQATLIPEAKHAIILNTPCSVHDLPGFEQGEISVQDAAAQLAVDLLQLKPNLRVLDACCAPGGKLCHILETQPKLQVCVGLDLNKQRLQRTQENLTRLNLTATLMQGDAAQPNTWWDGKLFDRILLDAPCSATGVIRRHPDIKLLRSTPEINEISSLQNKILKALWPLLAPNGILVYATCSIMPQENEQQIANFLQEHSDSSSIPILQKFGYQTPHGKQILPGMHNMDGFFYSVICKSL